MTHHLTRDEPERFTRVFNFLSKSKNSKYDEVKIAASFAVLGDLPIESVELAAQTLAKEANSFFPDDGSWYEVADNHAASQLVANAQESHYLTAPHMEDDERARTLKARQSFVEQYERVTGKVLPETHVWKSPLRLVTFHCHLCSDSGWRDYTCTERNQCEKCLNKKLHINEHGYCERCVCWRTNPHLEARRARVHLSQRRRANKRSR